MLPEPHMAPHMAMQNMIYRYMDIDICFHVYIYCPHMMPYMTYIWFYTWPMYGSYMPSAPYTPPHMGHIQYCKIVSYIDCTLPLYGSMYGPDMIPCICMAHICYNVGAIYKDIFYDAIQIPILYLT